MLRFESLSISAWLCLVLALFFVSASLPRSAVAQSSGSGVTCSTIGGVYTCTQNGTGGQVCVTDVSSGTQTCQNLTSGGSSSSGGSGSLGTGLGSTQQSPGGGPGTGWLSKLTWWFSYAIQTLFYALVAFLKDLVTYLLGVILSVVSSAISAIGVPSWISQYSLGGLLGNAGGAVMYFAALLMIPQGFTLLAAGYAFRLVRKVLTLFQW